MHVKNLVHFLRKFGSLWPRVFHYSLANSIVQFPGIQKFIHSERLSCQNIIGLDVLPAWFLSATETGTSKSLTVHPHSCTTCDHLVRQALKFP